MPLSLAAVERWDTQSIRVVGQALTNSGASMSAIQDGFKRLPHLGNWSGDASDAANENIDHLGRYLGENAVARQEAGRAMSRAADEIEGVKQLLSRVTQVAAEGKFRIDSATGAVTPLDPDCDPDTLDYLITTIGQIQAAAEVCDQELAHAVNLAGGTEPADATVYDGKLIAAAARRRNQIDAFRQATGHTPASPSDWQTAAVLDSHNYDPKYKGAIRGRGRKNRTSTRQGGRTNECVHTWPAGVELRS